MNRTKIYSFIVLMIVSTFSFATDYSVSNPKGMENFEKDKYNCEIQSRMATPPRNPWASFDDIRYDREKRELYLQCMKAQGYVYTEN